LKKHNVSQAIISILLGVLLLTASVSCGVSLELKPSLSSPAFSQQDQSNIFKVHFLDVGQAECILIQAPSGKNMLIDAGNNADWDIIHAYLEREGISKLDIVVGTHPHEDHIGSLDKVINTYEIGQVVMPRKTATTQTYKDVLTAITKNGMKITTAKAGLSLDLGEDVTTTLIAPNSSDYEDTNNYSAVLRIEYGETSFLFTGDAESKSESEMITSGYPLQADVLKVGHHGSAYSTSAAFINKVQPKIAIISVGEENGYGHPHQETLTRLSKIGTKVLRTDLQGTIVMVTDGEKVRISNDE